MSHFFMATSFDCLEDWTQHLFPEVCFRKKALASLILVPRDPTSWNLCTSSSENCYPSHWKALKKQREISLLGHNAVSSSCLENLREKGSVLMVYVSIQMAPISSRTVIGQDSNGFLRGKRAPGVTVSHLSLCAQWKKRCFHARMLVPFYWLTVKI